MLDQGGLWGIATIIGPLLLLAAMIYGVMMYRHRSHASKRQTDEATRRMYKAAGQEEREEEAIKKFPPIKPTRGR